MKKANLKKHLSKYTKKQLIKLYVALAEEYLKEKGENDPVFWELLKTRA